MAKTTKKTKDSYLKVNVTFSDFIKVSVAGNPKPKAKKEPKKKK